MKYYAYSIALVASAHLLACSGGSERELAQIDDIVSPDSGRDQRIPDGGEAPDMSDSDIADVDDELVPNDADRSDHGNQCANDDQCTDWIEPGPCERPACEKGYCVKALVPKGTSCDDSNACTLGDYCQEGRCQAGAFDSSAPGCVQDPHPGSLWFTEVMGNPVGAIDPLDGQWFEIGGGQPVRLDGLKLIYFEWEGVTAPTNPTSPVIFQLAPGHSDRESHSLFLRSQDINKNGYGFSAWSYSKIKFSKSKNARLMIVLPNWNGAFPVSNSHVVAKVEIPAGVFSDANAGRSWQRSASSPSDAENAVWCHSTMEYFPSNWGSPGQPNSDCP